MAHKCFKNLTLIVIIVLLLIDLSSCASRTSYNKLCYICDRTPTFKYVTAKGTDRYYCESHCSKCGICDAKATSNYTNLLDFHVFTCDKHKK